MLDLWLIRHGETEWNAEGRIQGQTDTRLSALGIEQAKRLGARLASQSYDHAYASDLRRASNTASIVLGHDDYVKDTRLRELDMGRYQGSLFGDLAAEDVEALRGWWLGDFDHSVGGGESGRDFIERVRSWIADLPPRGRVIAFAHGGTLRSVLAARLAADRQRVLYLMGNTCITRLQLDGDSTTVVTLNDTAHLEGDMSTAFG